MCCMVRFRLVFEMVMKCMFSGMGLFVFSWVMMWFCRMCSSLVCRFSGIELILFSSIVLSCVCLNLLNCVWIVLGNVFVLWLNSLDLISVVGRVV